MKLSVIIVNYNVKFYLEQCLWSLLKSLEEAHILNENEAEILVVDNCSSDGSVDYLSAIFPTVQFLTNSENKGFGKANNQALQYARGEYVLFLNPDTILSGNTIDACLRIMANQQNTGAIGVRMLDGSGRYLPESKRGFPNSWRALCKFSGLCALFPNSRIFAGYYLGYLDAGKNQLVEVLSGAFMFCRKTTLYITQGFDETFFMYAEDIDLCYRIHQAGFFNFYLADTTIIHFKGESTKKDIQYLRLFYGAMNQFIHKHYTNFISRIFALILGLGIQLRLLWSALLLRLQPGDTIREKKYKSFFLGNTNSSLTQSILKTGDRTLAGSIESADELIFCEGTSLSFAEIIRKMEELKTNYSFKIHADSSQSFVGSESRSAMGFSAAISKN